MVVLRRSRFARKSVHAEVVSSGLFEVHLADFKLIQTRTFYQEIHLSLNLCLQRMVYAILSPKAFSRLVETISNKYYSIFIVL